MHMEMQQGNNTIIQQVQLQQQFNINLNYKNYTSENPQFQTNFWSQFAQLASVLQKLHILSHFVLQGLKIYFYIV